VIYLVEGEAGLNLLAAYAGSCGARGHPDRLRIGEGLIGQCAADARRFLITDIPSDGVQISSGLFRAAPRSIVVLPVSFEGQVQAVIQLASLGSFTPLHVSFLEQLTASVGIVLNSIEATMKTEGLLKQTQRLAAELQAQQRELQQRVAARTAELADANAGLERRVEERTREHEAALAQVHEMQKLESLGQLTGGVAHDFNNLLAAIIGNLEMMAAVLPKRGPARRYAETALSAASRGSRLTQHLLAFSRRQEIRPQTVSTNDILSETLLLCRQTIGAGVEIESRLQPDTWPCRIDPAQFEAAILNLAVNARDAMNHSGRLTITTENVTANHNCAADLAPGDYSVVSVSDTGCGMSEDVLSRAFEPFYTTKEIGKGTGLGLSQVYGFAKQSGGTVQIESEVGRGTKVRIYIPRQEGPLTGEVAMAEEVSGPALGNATILVAEDDPAVRETVVGILSNFGYRPLVARNGPEALAILQNEETVDVLLSDVVMSAGMSGTDLARTAQRLWPELKILLTSGYTGVEPEPSGVRGEFAFIAKPYRAPMLGRKLREILAGKPMGRTRV
jgi:signal transduction histidine kinase/CheY-like chemotaxis protein